MKKTGLYILLLACLCLPAEAQIMKKLGNAVKNAAESATVRKAEEKTDETVSNAIDKVTNPDTYKGEKNATEEEASADEPAVSSGSDKPDSTTASAASKTQPKSAEMTWAKFDFVAGDEIIFDDNQAGEKNGEFPSQWDLIGGNAEITLMDGTPVIAIIDEGVIAPLMNDMKSYLPEAFTIEYDLWIGDEDHSQGYPRFVFYATNADDFTYEVFSMEWWRWGYEGQLMIEYKWFTPAGEHRSGNTEHFKIDRNKWHHLSISFNKRAMKVYLDETRQINIPNCGQPRRMEYQTYKMTTPEFIRNFRIAQGAMPLYDRMMSDGKFITYGITFDVGKSVIKPESAGEINRIVDLLKQNPELRFSVEGHTDSTGNASSNQTLSDARSKAVVDKLVEMGIPADRLKSAGKGQGNPIADNKTDEGRAKNRRVEFVKI